MTILYYNMANYRRELTKYDQKNLLGRYRNHKDAEGGIFTESTRRRLLGIKAESAKEFPPDTADFWSDVRKFVKNGLKDLELICDVAHPDQIEEMFYDQTLSKKEHSELEKIKEAWEQTKFLERLPSLRRFLTALFKDYVVIRKVMVERLGKKYDEPIVIGSDAGKAYLAHDVVVICLTFLKEHGFVSTKAHERLVEEVEDMINVEVARGTQLKRHERVKGFV